MKKNEKNQPGKTADKGNKRTKPIRKHPEIKEPKANPSKQEDKIDEDIKDITDSASGLEDKRQHPLKINKERDDLMPAGPEDEIKMKPGNNGDVGDEDMEALGPEDLSMDMGDDEKLKHRTWPVDFEGRDLDVPGSELDDKQEDIGSEDEENNPYSLGGDRHEDLEEDKS
jgi:hypothetical protein